MAVYIDFQKLNQSLCTEAVLRFLDLPAKCENDGQIRIKCPIHRSDNQASLAIDPHKKEFCCHSYGCGAKGDLIQFAALILGVTNYKAALSLSNQNNLFQRIDKKSEHQIVVKVSLGENLKSAQQAWKEAREGNEHPYLKSKMVEHCPSLRYGPDQKGNYSIVVPFYNLETSELQTVQYINVNGKYYLKGSNAKGAAFPIGDIVSAKTLYVQDFRKLSMYFSKDSI